MRAGCNKNEFDSSGYVNTYRLQLSNVLAYPGGGGEGGWHSIHLHLIQYCVYGGSEVSVCAALLDPSLLEKG